MSAGIDYGIKMDSLDLQTEVSNLRRWRLNHGAAQEYPDWWTKLVPAAEALLAEAAHDGWSENDVENLLYVVANDPTDWIAERISESPSDLLALSRRALGSECAEQYWPLAVELGKLDERKGEAESLLLEFTNTSDEYVQRRALLALSDLGAPCAVELALKAWESGHEYQRMAALSVFEKSAPELFAPRLKDAMGDARPNLRSFAERALARAGSEAVSFREKK